MVRATAPAETTARTIPEAIIAVLSPVEGLVFLLCGTIGKEATVVASGASALFVALPD